MQLWSIFSGTLVNVATVAIGSALGIVLSTKLAQRYRTIVLQALGLMTITLAIDAAVLKYREAVEKYEPLVSSSGTLGAHLGMIMIVSLVAGSLIGSFLRLHERIEGTGAAIHKRFAGNGETGRFAEGFLTASIIFCIGPLTLIGCLENGAHGNPSYLYIKAILDGFCSIALAASFGWGVFASIATVLSIQGGLAILAYYVAKPLDELSLLMMTAVGGVILLATSLMILDIKKIPVADMTPAILLPPVIIHLVELIKPGLLLPSS